MEKLKPILNQKFWILSTLAILLPIYPWMSTLGTMQQDFKSKETQIQDAFNKVPKDKSLANQKWIDPVVNQTKEEEKDYVKTKVLLWDMHRGLMKWPQGTLDIENKMRDSKVRFWGEIPVSILRAYREDFPVLKLDLYRKLKAFPPSAQATSTTTAAAAPGFGTPVAAPAAIPVSIPATKPAEVKKGEELIAFPFEELPLKPLDKSTTDITSKEVWETQEDIWLLEAIFNALNNVNQDQPIPAQAQGDAVIKQLYKVELMGGAKSRLAGPSGEGGAAPAAPPPAAGGAAGPAGTSAAFGGDKIPFSFNPSEEFGPLSGVANKALATGGAAGTSATAAAAAGAKPATPALALGGAKPATPTAPAVPAAASASASNVPVVPDVGRYIDKEAPLSQRTRGFYIEVLMDHRKLPQLLTELRNSPWTTRVVRVQAVAKENGIAPTVQSYTYNQADPLAMNPGGAGAPNLTPGMNTLGVAPGQPQIRMRRRRDEEDEPRGAATTPAPVLQQPEPQMEAGPLGDPRLAYVAICGVITIYLPPTEAGNAVTAVAPDANVAPSQPPATGSPAGVSPSAAPSAPAAPVPAAPVPPASPKGAAPTAPAVATPPAAPKGQPAASPAAAPPPATPPKK